MFMLSRQHRIFLILYAMLSGTSCTQDYIESGVIPDRVPGKVAVSFEIEIPVAVPVQSYAAYSDCDVLNMDVLVFDQNDTFLERVGSDMISGNGAVKSFTVRIDPSATRRTFMVIANARTASGVDRIDMTSLTPGMSVTDALTALKTKPLAGGRADEILPLVMFGRGELSKVDGTTGRLSVSLRRAVACIQIRTAAPTASNGLANFTLLRGTLSQAAGFGLVAPGSGTGPNVPSGLTFVDYWTSDTDDAGWSVGSNPVLYAYERSNTLDYMSLLVKASWRGREYYYRLVMQGTDGGPIAILRNHRYTVSIVSVNAPGWESATQAMANAPANDIIKMQITDATDDIFCIVADGHYMLGLTCNCMERWGRSVTTGKMRMGRFLKATHPSASTLLKATGETIDGGTIKNDVTFTPSSGVSDGYFDMHYSRQEPIFDNYTGDMYIRCGNLAHYIEVRFVEKKFVNLPPAMAKKDADSYAFLVADENTPKPWRVWIPTSKTMRLSPSASAADFTPGAGSDNSGWGTNLMESRTAARAYLHVPARTNSCAEEWLILTDGNGLVRRITIGQHD